MKERIFKLENFSMIIGNALKVIVRENVQNCLEDKYS